MTPTPRLRAFTLVELLVVIAVIAILIGVLLPALAGARASSYQIKDAATQKQLLLGMTAWANENDLEIPGVNTSGLRLNKLKATPTKLDKSSRPVQNFDWLTLALDDTQLPDDRSQRFAKILNDFVGPSNRQTLTSMELDYASNPGTMQEFMEGSGAYANGGPQTIYSPTYFMAATWQWAGPTVVGSATNITDQRYEQPVAEQGVGTLPSEWFPRATNVGSASLKVAISNAAFDITGTDKLPVGIWIEPDDKKYGAFCSSSPCRKDTKNFVIDPQSRDLEKSYPHSGRMNGGYWDGHVSALTPAQSQDPSLWYPRGTVWDGSNATKLANDLYNAGDKVN